MRPRCFNMTAIFKTTIFKTAIFKTAILKTATFAPVLLAGAIWCAPASAQPVQAVGVENQYANVIAAVGGKDVNVSAVVTNPNTDPHIFEVSPQVARQFAGADLVVENGLGYDAWADKIIAAVVRPSRRVINVQQLRGLPDSTPNPHLWYDPATMPLVAQAIAAQLTAMRPADAAYFQARLNRFDASLRAWNAALASFRKQYAGTPVAVTEPVADYMLQAAGARIATPFSLEAAVMNGTDPAPQDVTAQQALLATHKVAVLVYNQQVTDPLTQSFLDLAKRNGIPVVGVYETMPTPGFDYASWMLAEVAALHRAVADHVSTERLQAGTP